MTLITIMLHDKLNQLESRAIARKFSYVSGFCCRIIDRLVSNQSFINNKQEIFSKIERGNYIAES